MTVRLLACYIFVTGYLADEMRHVRWRCGTIAFSVSLHKSIESTIVTACGSDREIFVILGKTDFLLRLPAQVRAKRLFYTKQCEWVVWAIECKSRAQALARYLV